MRRTLLMAPLMLVVILGGCGQKGPLYIPPEQEAPAVATPDPGLTAAEEIDRDLDAAVPAETQDEQTLGEEDTVEDEDEVR